MYKAGLTSPQIFGRNSNPHEVKTVQKSQETFPRYSIPK